MQALTVDVESDSFTRLYACVAPGPGDPINAAAFDVKKPFRTQVIDELDDAVDRRSIETGYAKVLGTNANG